MATLAELQARHRARRWIAMFDWNMATYTGDESDPGTQDIDTWNPTNTITPAECIDQWMRYAVAGGADAAYITVNHSSGFCLYPSTVNPDWNISQTAWYAANGSPDLVRIFVEKARQYGLDVGIYLAFDNHYFNIHDADYDANINAYDMAIVTEVLTRYGPIDLLFIDGWSYADNPSLTPGYDLIPYAPMRALIAELQPDCLVINNNHEGTTDNSDVASYEQNNPDEGNVVPSDKVKSLWTSRWFYVAGTHTYNQGFEDRPSMNASLISYGALNTTVTLGIAVGPNGLVPQDALMPVTISPDFYDKQILARSSVVGYWPCTETAPNLNFHDFTANGNNARVQNDDGTNWTAGTWGITGPVAGLASNLAATFAGTGYALLGNPTALKITGQISISFWLNWATLPASGNQIYFGYAFDATNQGYLVRSRQSGGLVLEIGSYNGSNHLATWTVTGISTNTWFHVAGVYTGAAWKLYINAVEKASSTDATGAVSCTGNIGIGLPSNLFAGTISRIAVDNVGLTAAQVLADYNLGANTLSWPIVTSPSAIVAPNTNGSVTGTATAVTLGGLRNRGRLA